MRVQGFDAGVYVRHGATSNIFENLNDSLVAWKRKLFGITLDSIGWVAVIDGPGLPHARVQVMTWHS